MSTFTGDTPRSALDESAWRALCETAAAQAMKGSGLSHDYYVERFSSAIDTQVVRLPEDLRAQALQIAQEWDYATPVARQETQDWNAENGYCSHGKPLEESMHPYYYSCPLSYLNLTSAQSADWRAGVRAYHERWRTPTAPAAALIA